MKNSLPQITNLAAEMLNQVSVQLANNIENILQVDHQVRECSKQWVAQYGVPV